MELKNKKHEAFCQAYVKTCRFNARKAYEIAFGSPSHSNTDRLMKREDIKERIAEISAEEAKRFDENSILNSLSEIAFCSDGQFTTSERIKAMELMSKVMGLQKQHIEMNAKINGSLDIVVDIVEDDEDVED